MPFPAFFPTVPQPWNARATIAVQPFHSRGTTDPHLKNDMREVQFRTQRSTCGITADFLFLFRLALQRLYFIFKLNDIQRQFLHFLKQSLVQFMLRIALVGHIFG